MSDLYALRCETCGGDLIKIDEGCYKCKSCGNIYYKKELPSELVISLNEALQLRRTKRFEDALERYELIIESHPDCQEAYWGYILADYGIEYVQDYNGGLVPTCHRVSPLALFDNGHVKKLLSLVHDDKKVADHYALRLAELERIRKSVYVISQQTKQKYDIFICYKQNTIANPNVRTQEAKWARELYNKLIGRYNVFFAEESLGSTVDDYEPNIFSALNSAKLMIIVTSSLDNLNSEWVKNEWGRYLRFAKKDSSKKFKVLCSGFNPEELPMGLRHTQALDHDDPEWYAKLTTVIDNVFAKPVQASKPVQQATPTQQASTVQPPKSATTSTTTPLPANFNSLSALSQAQLVRDALGKSSSTTDTSTTNDKSYLSSYSGGSSRYAYIDHERNLGYTHMVFFALLMLLPIICIGLLAGGVLNKYENDISGPFLLIIISSVVSIYWFIRSILKTDNKKVAVIVLIVSLIATLVIGFLGMGGQIPGKAGIAMPYVMIGVQLILTGIRYYVFCREDYEGEGHFSCSMVTLIIDLVFSIIFLLAYALVFMLALR